MIQFANLTPEQEEIVKEACVIQIDALISARVNAHKLRAYYLRKYNEDYEEKTLLESIDELMNMFSELRQNPQKVLSYPKKITDQIQIVTQWYLDDYKGNPQINALYYKFIQLKELKETTQVN